MGNFSVKRVLAFLALISISFAVSGGINTDTAFADSTPCTPDSDACLTDGSNYSSIEEALRDWANPPEAAPGSSATEQDIEDALLAADDAGASGVVVPALTSVVGTTFPIIVSGAAVYTGWKIGSEIYKIFANPDTFSPPVVTSADIDGWRLAEGTLNSHSVPIGPVWYWQVHITGEGANTWRAFSCDAAANCASDPYIPALLASEGTQLQECGSISDDGCTKGNPSHNYYAVYLQGVDASPFENGHTNIEDCDASCYSAAYVKTDQHTFTPPSSLSETDTNNIVSSLLSQANQGDQNAKDARDALKHKITSGFNDYPEIPDCAGETIEVCEAAYEGAGFTGTETIETLDTAGADVTKPAGAVVSTDPAGGSQVEPSTDLTITVNPDNDEMPWGIPRPLIGETYDTYLARLQGLGYVGSMSQSDLTDETADPQMGPNGVATVTFEDANGNTRTLTPENWPTVLPVAALGVAIHVQVNPGDLAAVPPEPPPSDPGNPGPFPGSGGSGGGGSCNCPPIDFSPIENINFGSHFPFGFFTWAGSTWENITGGISGDGTPIAITLPLFGDNKTYELQSDLWENTYRPIVFTILEFLMTFGAIWFFCTKFLGMGR